MRRRGLLPLLFVLAAAGRPAAAGSTTFVVAESEHYRVYAEAAQAEADEMVRVLEAAWPQFAAWFGAEPKRDDGERLLVRFYRDELAWRRGIVNDGTVAPREAGGYYWPASRTAYLFRQPTRYYTRVLLLHEAAHQFHYLARTGNKRPSAGWYAEAVAEHLSWHSWDGETLRLALRPDASLENHPARALAEMAAEGFDLEAVVEGRVPASRAVVWALGRYFATGEGGKPLPGFAAFAGKMDRGTGAGTAFRSAFGAHGPLRDRIVRWLEGEQQPWTPVFLEWEGIGPNRLRGHAGVVTVCRLSEPAAALEATLEIPAAETWKAGLLLQFADPGAYTVGLVHAQGRLAIDRRASGTWERLALLEVPAPVGAGALRLAARREGVRVWMRVDEVEYGPWTLPGGGLGLALDDGDVRFRDLRWTPAPP
jgi:hypothetical protein